MPSSERILGRHLFDPSRGWVPRPGVTLRSIDALLGVDGLPQSGTGQTAILTGENAPALLGRHFGPYPHSGLRDLLRERNFFRELIRLGRSCAYLNAFPEQYFNYLGRHPNMAGAFPTAWRMAGNRLNSVAELAAGRALSADITSAGWGRLGHPELPVISPEKAADIAARVLSETDFVLYEYYFTDHAGHGRAGTTAERILPLLDRFIGALAERIIPAGHTLLLTSDHGNLEDLTVRTHTLNPVPFLAAGAGHAELAAGVGDLTAIRRAVLGHFTRREGRNP